MKKIKTIIVFILLICVVVFPLTSRISAIEIETNDSSSNVTALSSVYSPNYFYSDYDIAKFYYANTFSHYGTDNIYTYPIYLDDGLQLRSNCYGYALRAFYAVNTFPSHLQKTLLNGDIYQNYKQQPGEFANKNSGLVLYNVNGSVYSTLYNRTDLNDALYYIISSNCSSQNRMNYLEQLLEADAATLGYTITEYTGTTIPDASTLNDKRMIALVASSEDYHFYMQHSDNTWSHKPGAETPMEQCFEHGTYLTNSTIRAHACESFYSGGAIKFYYITKNAVDDFAHLDGTYTSETSSYGLDCVKTSISNTDMAGDYYCSAKDIGSVPRTYSNAKFNFVGDVDYYVFSAEASATYTFTVSPGVNNIASSISMVLYSDTNNILRTATGATNGSVTFTYALSAGEQYILKISSSGQSTHRFAQFYNITITS